MRLIPAGPSRRVLPAPATSTATGIAVGAESAVALQQLGGTLTRIGEERQAERVARLKDAKAKADQSTTLLRFSAAKTDLQQQARNVSEQVQSGQLDEINAVAAWDEVKQRVRKTATEGVRPDLAQTIDNSIKVQANELFGNQVDMAFRQRYRDVTRGNLMGLMEGYERDALTDRPKALQMAQEAVGSLGYTAGYGADDQVRLMQGLREKTAYNSAVQQMDAARGNVAQLEQFRQRLATDEFADLSPDRRVMVEERVMNRQATIEHQQEVQRQRAVAAQERRLRDAEHSFKAAQGVYDGGAVMDDASLAQLQQTVRGTPYAAAVKSLVAQGAERAMFGSLSPIQQETALLGMRNQINAEGVSPAGLERLRRFETINAQTREQAEKEPLKWAQQSRLLDTLTPLDMSGGLQSLVGSMAVRVDQARTVGAQLGKAVSPLLSSEAQLLGETLEKLPLDQKKGAVRMLAGALPPEQQRALAGQVNAKDPALALAMHAASLPPGSGPDVVDLMLRGQDAVKAGRIKDDDTTTKQDRLQIAKDISAVPWPSTQARDAAISAASLVYDGQRDLKGSGSRREAVRLATGGGPVDWGEGKTLLPPGWTESRFKSAMRALTADDLVRQARGPLFINGAQVAPAALLKAMPSATLLPVGPGQYALDAGGMVVNAQRRPFIFSLGR